MYLQKRHRILRSNPAIRSLVAETILTPSDFIAPLFIVEGENIREEISSMNNGEGSKRALANGNKKCFAFCKI
jgi:delta-aminolevulinic acid dehydratase/porphobilinogen synthase